MNISFYFGIRKDPCLQNKKRLFTGMKKHSTDRLLQNQQKPAAKFPIPGNRN